MTRPTTTKQLVMPATAIDTIWDAILPIPAGVNVSDDFEARVQRVWNYIKTAYFAVDEHDRLRAALGTVIAMEAAMTSGSSRDKAS